MTATRQRARAAVKNRATPTSNRMTEAEVIQLIKAAQGNDSIRTFAAQVGVSAAYISDIYLGKRKPGLKILKYFGMGKVRTVLTEYVVFAK